MTSTRSALLISAAALAFLACDDESLAPPQTSSPIFARYVALGNSITAGFESGGINDSTQRNSYAVLLAEAMGLEIGSEFSYPSLAMPGCPPPLVNIFTLETIDTIPGDCAFRANASTRLNLLAVPGAATIDIISNLDGTSSPNPLTTFILGGRTQLEAAAQIDPTFVTVWIGNNDVLGAILDGTNPGEPGLITRARDFQSAYDSLMAGLDALGTIQGGVLIGVVQVRFAPYASTGAEYWQASQSIPTLTVDNNCLATTPITGTSDTASVLIPFHYGAPIMAAASGGTPQTIDCSVDAVISADEAAFMTLVVEGYNDIIEQHAVDRSWAYVDPNTILQTLLQDPTQIRPFPAFDPADPQHEDAPFGTAVTRDGIHPSASAQILILNAVVDAINTTYGTSLSGQ